MKFSTSFLAVAVLLITSTTAVDVWGMSGSTITKPTGEVQLEIHAFQGPEGNPFRCQRNFAAGSLRFPIKNLAIPCQASYSLIFSWENESKDMSSMFGTPGTAPVAYNPQAYACTKTVGSHQDGGCKFGFKNGPSGSLFSGSAQPGHPKREEKATVAYKA